MLWKDSYKIGIEIVDQQHQKLFEATGGLLKALTSDNGQGHKQECIQTIIFLKNYALEHFATEEKFLEERSYVDIVEHKNLHKEFVQTVLVVEKQLVQSDFAMPVIRQLTGFLSSWLIYHVAGMDQKLATGQSLKNDAFLGSEYIKCFSESITDVLQTMTGLNALVADFGEKNCSGAAVCIRVDLIGDVRGQLTYAFPQQTALALLKAMTAFEIPSIDEITLSALSEITNIATGGAAARISNNGIFCDITTPRLLSEETALQGNGFTVDTTCGLMDVLVRLDEVKEKKQIV